MESGRVSNRKALFSVKKVDTGPDGRAMDGHGNIWAALFGHWRVVRISSEEKVRAEVNLSVRCPTVSHSSGGIPYEQED